MLSVKHVRPDGESVYLAQEASYSNATHLVSVIRDNVPPLELEGGVVYVMNDHGKTVSIYRLERKERP